MISLYDIAGHQSCRFHQLFEERMKISLLGIKYNSSYNSHAKGVISRQGEIMARSVTTNHVIHDVEYQNQNHVENVST